MHGETMDLQLRRAWAWLLAHTHGNEELATDALPYVWLALSRQGARLTTRTIKRALWHALHHDGIGKRSPGSKRHDALQVAGRLFEYCESRSSQTNPVRQSMIREAVKLVKRAAQTPMQRQIVKGLLLGTCAEQSGRAAGKSGTTAQRSLKTLRERCQAAWPSLIGIA